MDNFGHVSWLCLQYTHLSTKKTLQFCEFIFFVGGYCAFLAMPLESCGFVKMRCLMVSRSSPSFVVSVFPTRSLTNNFERRPFTFLCIPVTNACMFRFRVVGADQINVYYREVIDPCVRRIAIYYFLGTLLHHF